MKRIAKWYLQVGTVLGGINLLSYVYAQFVILWHAGLSLHGLIGMSLADATGMANAVLRIIVWLPSFVIWVSTGTESFWRWLAPGLFVEIGAKTSLL